MAGFLGNLTLLPFYHGLRAKSYEGMKAQQAQMTAYSARRRLPQALEWLVELYEATNRPDQAAAWRKQLEDAKKAGAKRQPARDAGAGKKP